MPTIRSRKPKQVLILVVDLLIFTFSLFLALLLRSFNLPDARNFEQHMLRFLPVFIISVVVFYTSGLYSLDFWIDKGALVRKTVVSSILGLLLSAVWFYADRNAPLAPKTILVLYFVLATGLFLVWRLLYSRLVKIGAQRIPVGLLCTDEITDELISAIKTNHALGYDIAFIFDEGSGPGDHAGDTRKVRTLEQIEELRISKSVVTFVLPWGKPLPEEMCSYLFSRLGTSMRYVSLPSFYEEILRKVPIGSINEQWFLENLDMLSSRPYLRLKRIADVVIAVIGCILAAPILLLTFLAVKCTSRGPFLFKQVRLGLGKKPFTIYKVRTMRIDRNDFAPTGVDDPRITLVGNFLRKTRIDELPQLVNILRGEMSVIGPRPERPELADDLAGAVPYYYQRLLVRPGVTGWDQVSGEYHSPSVEDTYKKLQYDLYYIKNLSPFLDISILFKTIYTALARKGR